LWLTRCVKHLRPRPAGYSRISRFPGGRRQRCKKWERRARGRPPHRSAGDIEIGGSISRASSVTSPLFDHLPTQHSLYQSRRRRRLHRSTPSPTEGGAAEVYSISGRGRCGGGLLHLQPREARRRSSSTLGLSSKSAVAVSNATGTSPCPPAHCSAVDRFSRPSL
jgi:hypothetical protein